MKSKFMCLFLLSMFMLITTLSAAEKSPLLQNASELLKAKMLSCNTETDEGNNEKQALYQLLERLKHRSDFGMHITLVPENNGKKNCVFHTWFTDIEYKTEDSEFISLFSKYHEKFRDLFLEKTYHGKAIHGGEVYMHTESAGKTSVELFFQFEKNQSVSKTITLKELESVTVKTASVKTDLPVLRGDVWIGLMHTDIKIKSTTFDIVLHRTFSTYDLGYIFSTEEKANSSTEKVCQLMLDVELEQLQKQFETMLGNSNFKITETHSCNVFLLKSK